MKLKLLICLGILILMLSGCSNNNNPYAQAYSDGYFDGLDFAINISCSSEFLSNNQREGCDKYYKNKELGVYK